jgi:hypothetical protein
MQVRLDDLTSILQGTHALISTDVVIGDNITVHGYSGGAQLVFARKILVHRRLLALDGKIASLNAGGFVFSASDGDHTVLLNPDTIYTGGTSADLVVGASVHVTGYLRGDGTILATRIRLAKKKTVHPTPQPTTSP